MLTRRGVYLCPRTEPASAATEQLERDGFTLLRQTHQLSPEAVVRAGQNLRSRTVVGLHEPLFYDG